MGSGITQVVAQAGFQVTLVDIDRAAVEYGLHRIERNLGRLVAHERLCAADADAARALIQTSTSLEAGAAAADHVIETVSEDLDVKLDVLARLDKVCREEV